MVPTSFLDRRRSEIRRQPWEKGTEKEGWSTTRARR